MQLKELIHVTNNNIFLLLVYVLLVPYGTNTCIHLSSFGDEMGSFDTAFNLDWGILSKIHNLEINVLMVISLSIISMLQFIKHKKWISLLKVLIKNNLPFCVYCSYAFLLDQQYIIFVTMYTSWTISAAKSDTLNIVASKYNFVT